MNAGRSPTDVVLALFRVINGELPRAAARELLDPMVRMHVDSAEFRGIDNWHKWIYLIRNCGRMADLRVAQCHVRCDAENPSLVHASAHWTGIDRASRAPAVSPRQAEALYRVQDGRIREMWTCKSNYEFIFGRWIRYSICFRLFLAGATLYLRVMALRKKDVFIDPIERGAPAKRR